MSEGIKKLKLSQYKTQVLMAKRCMDPYALCSNAGISYTSYRRIMKNSICKLSTLGKIAKALECDVSELIEG